MASGLPPWLVYLLNNLAHKKGRPLRNPVPLRNPRSALVFSVALLGLRLPPLALARPKSHS